MLTARRSANGRNYTTSRTASAQPTTRLACRSILLLLALISIGNMVARSQVNVTMYHNDIGRTGQNLNETQLTTANVNANTFGKLFSQPVDDQIYAQPLYLTGVTINGATHNVVFVATENNSVYAFDADSNGGANASPLWHVSLMATNHGAAAGATTIPSSMLGSDIFPQVGITGTPVIDAATGTLYVVNADLEGSAAVQRLHALDVATGNEKLGGPVVITAQVTGSGNGSTGGKLTFDPLWENQRGGLLLLNGVVWIDFASHNDNGPWHGWLLGYNAATLTQTGLFCTSPNGTGSGFWGAGGGIPADVLDPVNHPYGRIFLPTGNGDFNATPPYTTNVADYGDSLLNLDATNGVPTVTDEFTPSAQASLDAQDLDQGSGGLMVLPTQTTGTVPHLLAQVGKSGTLYLVNRDNMGGYSTSAENVVQVLSKQIGNPNSLGAWSTPAYWNGHVYVWGRADNLKSFPLVNGQLGTPTTSVEAYGFPGATPSISANGNTQGIVWTLDTDGYLSAAHAVLQAHSASNVATTLYSSNTNSARDTAGPAVKFTVPTVTNGKVYVGTANQLNVYGLLNVTQTAATPVLSPGTETFTGSVSVSITDTTPAAIIYYTLDGSTPTTSSAVYTSPITVTLTTTIHAIASATGFLQSAMATGVYTNPVQTATPTFSPAGGTYTSAQSVTISDSVGTAAIYYTTDGTTPTTGSNLYTGPISVGITETIKAIAVAAGSTNSAVATAAYTIQSTQPGTISFPQGFAASAGVMILSGSAQLNDSRLQLTSGLASQAGSAWYYTPVNIQNFTSDFTFQLSNPVADGMTFTIQGNSNTSLGNNGGSLGYAPIANSVAIKFDLFNNVGEGSDSTGLYLNGAMPTLPSIDLSSTGIDLHSDDNMAIHLSYNGSVLAMSITDMVTAAVWSTSWTVNIPATVGGNTAYVGFTGGTGGSTASQKILTWSLTPGAATTPVAATPTFTPVAGTYTGAQSVTISDTTAGAAIYYTTNGTTPTTSSNLYGGPIAVNATQTVQAIAVAAGFTNSAVATAAYTINTPIAATPTLSPGTGTYTSAQTVTISDTTAGAKIYYTTNGSTPTTASNLYSGPITVGTTQTVKAIAVATGFANSAVATAVYTINAGQSGFSFASGFTAAGTSITLNGRAALSGPLLQLTDGNTWEASSAFYSTPVNVQSFTTDFAIQLLNANADGMTFTIQNNAPTTLGPLGGDLGYTGIGNSVAIKFDLFNNSGEGSDSTGLYLNGAAPTVPSTDLSATPINLHSGDTMAVHLTYDGATLAMTITDQVTGGVYSSSLPLNIATVIGANTAYVGFTAGTGGSAATQNVVTWSYTSGGTIQPTVASPTFSPAAGTYTSTQSVTISDTTAGAKIYYTTNGTTPTTSSPLYSGPVSVSTTQTLEAIAVATGFTNSAVATAAYTINLPVAATPTFTPVAGTYTSAQTVSITDTTAGAKIYYTTNGTTPTAASTLYAGAISVGTTQTLKAIAIATGFTNSAVASAVYTINLPVAATPTFSPAAGTYTGTQSISISDTTATATIYYTTNGTAPTAASTLYAGPISVASTQTIKAIAIATGFTNSAVATAVYTINTPIAATPTFSPAAGTYTGAQTVTINDTTAGAKIYYTTNGTTPTTASTLYSAPISVGVTESVKAIAVATGFTNSAVATAAYTINLPVAATPTFSPLAGSYASAQSVTISDTTAAAIIYFTTDGTNPTTSSTVYSAPIAVSATQTIKAVAVATGFVNSAVASATYTIGSTIVVNYGTGFPATGLSLNGGAKVSGGVLQLTDAASNEARSAWYSTAVSIQKFTSDFNFQLTSATADGFTFTIQNSSKTAVGSNGMGLGYSNIGKSVAIKFDLFSNAGEGVNSTGLYTNGAMPTLPAVDMTPSGVNLHSGDVMHAHITYDGTTLTLTLTDTATGAIFTNTTAINISGTIGGTTAYVGFTGGTGGSTAVQNILNWTYATN